MLKMTPFDISLVVSGLLDTNEGCGLSEIQKEKEKRNYMAVKNIQLLAFRGFPKRHRVLSSPSSQSN